MAFTYFFRDLQTLEMICDHALPLLRTKRRIKVWDAGCAMGPEPYSLAMMLKERVGHMYFRNIMIYATDIDGSNLFDHMIRNAVYPREQIERIPQELFEKYFEAEENESRFRIREEIRKCVCFQKHDLLTLKSIGRDFDLILCKNVLLHFNESQRIEILKMFYDSLSDDGYLALEQTQKLPQELSDHFESVVSNAQLFKKIGQSANY
jgi:chemotaxis protein methyltransferase CheR